MEDKREVTLLLTINMAGKILPPQLIYSGKTTRCLPAYSFPSDWNVTFSESHWSTVDTMLEYCDKILRPYLASVRSSLGRPNQKALLILDVFAVHRCDVVKEMFASMNCELVYVPAGCTGDLQPLDLAVKEDYKKCLKSHFSEYYANEVANDDVDTSIPFKMSAAILKPLHAG